MGKGESGTGPEYLAYHCLYCGDSGREDGSHDPTMWDNVSRRSRPCFACDGFGAILIGARYRQTGKPYRGERWPERDI